MCLLVFVPDMPLPLIIVVLAVIGLSGAFMSVCFALVREISPTNITASVTGIVNSMTVASGAILQPAVGFLLDRLWDGGTLDGAPIYLASDYRNAFMIILAACLVGFITSLTLKESPQWAGEKRQPDSG